MLKGKAVQDGIVVVGIGETILCAHASAGYDSLIHEILFQISDRAVTGKASGGGGKFSADNEQTDRIGCRKNVCDLQRRRQHGEPAV